MDAKAKKAKVEIDVASIDTANSIRDNHLRNEDFFDVPNFPKAFFEVLNVKENSPNSLILTGKLTIKNIEKTYEILKEIADQLRDVSPVNKKQKKKASLEDIDSQTI